VSIRGGPDRRPQERKELTMFDGILLSLILLVAAAGCGARAVQAATTPRACATTARGKRSTSAPDHPT